MQAPAGALWSRLIVVCLLAGKLKYGSTETVTVCTKEDLSISCGQDEAIVVSSARFGHMEVGRCIPSEDQFLGCSNDMLSVADGWCSGRQSCDIVQPNFELENINTECLPFLKIYMEATFHCIEVHNTCQARSPNPIANREGFISSYVTKSAGCGSSRSPWVISADPGQTVNITMLDFAASPEDGSVVTCRNVYGYILERALGINHTICGGADREVALYSSKANQVEVIITSRNPSESSEFLLQYNVIGCQDLSRPPYAWYKREGSEALIGCETNDQQWRLTCTGNTWHGTVGNCSAPPPDVNIVPEDDDLADPLAMPSLVLLTGIGAAALVVVVVIIVIGVIYVKKQRIREETKKMTLTYPTMDKHSQAYYRPVSTGQPTTFGKVPDNMSGSWEMTFPPRADTTTSYPAPCACSTLPYRPDANHARSMSAASSDGTTYETPKFVDSVPLTSS